jgi:hypothetical protein
MRNRFLCGFLFMLAACGGGGSSVVAPPKKLDPYITIRVRDMFDTTSAAGKAHWHVYLLLTGPEVNQNGVARQGALSLEDLRLNHNLICMRVIADSVGQRLVAPLAVADTTVAGLTPDQPFDAFAEQWYAGNHTVPAGWRVVVTNPTDAWQSAQFAAGHGLTDRDPIRWIWDWDGSSTGNFAERDAADTGPCSTFSD